MIPKVRPVSGRTVIFLFLMKKNGSMTEIVKWCKTASGNFIKFEDSTIFREIRDMMKEGLIEIYSNTVSEKNKQKITLYKLTSEGLAMAAFYRQALLSILQTSPPQYRKMTEV